MSEDERRTGTAMIVLPCPTCGRSVTVLGRMRRVLCACGQILLEVGRANASVGGDSVPKTI